MTDHTDNGLNLGNFVFMIIIRNKNRVNVLYILVKDLWWYFCPNFFVILLILACFIVRITLAETREEATV